MRCKKLCAAVFVMALSVSVMAGCNKQKVTKEEENKTTEIAAVTEKTEDNTQADAVPVTMYPEITSDKKMKDYQSVITIPV